MSRKDRLKKGRAGQLPPFIPIFRHVQRTKAWAALSATDKAVYIEIKLRYNGSNNGQLAISVRELADLNNISKDTASRSVKRLCEVGLLAVETPSGFGTNGRKAAEYRLTDHPTNIFGKQSAPTREFEKWEPENKSSSDERDISVSPQGHKGPGSKTGDRSCITTGTRKGVLPPSHVSPQGHSIDIPQGSGPLGTASGNEPSRSGRSNTTSDATANPSPKHISSILEGLPISPELMAKIKGGAS